MLRWLHSVDRIDSIHDFEEYDDHFIFLKFVSTSSQPVSTGYYPAVGCRGVHLLEDSSMRPEVRELSAERGVSTHGIHTVFGFGTDAASINLTHLK